MDGRGGFISIERRGRVAILTIERPDSMNAVATRRDCDDVVDALAAIQEDAGVSAAILTGRGRAFSTGGNLRAMKERTGIGPRDKPDETRANYRRGLQRMAKALYDCEAPLIAAVNGHAIGLGLGIASLCDIRIASQEARFAASFIKMGLVPGDGGAWSLANIVGYPKAAELFLTGDTFGPDEALAIGLVSQVVAADALIDAALALANRIADNPARALRLTKRLLRDAQHQRLADSLELAAALQALAHATSDHAEAVDAFLEKRAPSFTGG